MANNSWKLLGNERLPAMIRPFWSYEEDTYSWRPKQYNTYKPIDTPLTLSRDYYNYVQAEKKIPNPLIITRGGLSDVDISALQIETLQYPDIKSQTSQTQAIFALLGQQMLERNMLPKKVVY